jgi:hypothetical protein
VLLTCWSAHSRVERQSRCVTYLWMWMWLGYDVSAVDADSGQAGVLETSLTDVVDTVCQSDITTVCPNTLLYTAVGVDAATSVQRAAAASDVGYVWWCRSPLDVSCSSLQRSTSVHPSVVDGRPSVPSTCTPDDSCTLLVD